MVDNIRAGLRTIRMGSGGCQRLRARLDVRDPEVDVIVCGAGMAGLCAAVSSLEAGAGAPGPDGAAAPGGSMRWSGGTIWTAPSMEVMERWVPGGSRVRQRQLVDGIAPGLAWLAS